MRPNIIFSLKTLSCFAWTYVDPNFHLGWGWCMDIQKTTRFREVESFGISTRFTFKNHNIQKNQRKRESFYYPLSFNNMIFMERYYGVYCILHKAIENFIFFSFYELYLECEG